MLNVHGVSQPVVGCYLNVYSTTINKIAQTNPIVDRDL